MLLFFFLYYGPSPKLVPLIVPFAFEILYQTRFMLQFKLLVSFITSKELTETLKETSYLNSLTFPFKVYGTLLLFLRLLKSLGSLCFMIFI